MISVRLLPRFILKLQFNVSKIYCCPQLVQMKRQHSTTTPVIGTHNGTFHCDEVLACFMLKQLPEYETAEILRSRDDKLLQEKCGIIVDVGGEFNAERKRYDHHQNSFQETFSSLRPDVNGEFNIRLSSAGLVYVYYGERVIESILKRERQLQLTKENLKLTYVQIYRNFISELDAIDNGVTMYEGGVPRYKISTHLSARIGRLNPSWQEKDANVDELFQLAMKKAGEEFVENVLEVACSWIKARDHVRKALEEAKSVHPTGEILILDTFCPWKSHLADLEKEYHVEGVPKLVIFSDGAGWRVAGVPIAPNSFLGRKFLPIPWRGLRNAELSALADIEDVDFVHHTGFIGGAKTKDAALAMAKKSIEWPEQ